MCWATLNSLRMSAIVQEQPSGSSKTVVDEGNPEDRKIALKVLSSFNYFFHFFFL